MSNRFARTFLILLFGCSVVAAYSSSAAFAEKAKQTVKTQKQEDACVFKGASCLKSCGNTPQMTGKAFCENQCANRMNDCLNNVKAITVDPNNKPKQTVNKKPTAQTTTPPKTDGGGVNKQGAQQNRNRR
jgi:hypothetical protein